jgi:protein-S-isoprenylcysteine O-methyltransferase Ste14
MSLESPWKSKRRLALAGMIVGSILVTAGLLLTFYGVVESQHLNENLANAELVQNLQRAALALTVGVVLIPVGAVLFIAMIIWRRRLGAFVPPPLPKAPGTLP